jgi:hypothetical protein
MDACVVCLPVEPMAPTIRAIGGSLPMDPHGISDGMVKIWQENQEMKQWMCRKMELSEINRQDEPRSTKLFSF